MMVPIVTSGSKFATLGPGAVFASATFAIPQIASRTDNPNLLIVAIIAEVLVVALAVAFVAIASRPQ